MHAIIEMVQFLTILTWFPRSSDDLQASFKTTITLFIRKREIIIPSVCLFNIMHWGNYEFLLQPQSYIWLGHKHYFFVLLGLKMIHFHWRKINHTIKTVKIITEQQQERDAN